MDKQTRPVRPGGMGRMRGSAEKAKDFKTAMKKLIRYSKPFWPAVLVAIILAIGSAILTIIGPDQISRITDEITKGLTSQIDLEKIKEIAIFVGSLYVTSGILGYLQSFIMATITQKFSRKMRNEISVKINKLPLKYFDQHSYGDTLSRVTNDVDTIGQSLNQSIGSLVSAVTTLIGVVIMMVITNWQMALTAILASLFGFSIMFQILKRSQKYFDRQQEELGQLNGHIEEVYSGHNVVKVYNGVEDAKKVFDEYNQRLFTCVRKSQFLSGMMHPLMNFIGNFGYVAVCIVGALLTMNHVISFGVIVAFMIYVRLFTNPLTTIAQATSSLQSAAAAAERIFEFIEEVELEDESQKTKKLDPKQVKGKIEFENVKFSYEPGKEIIKNFSAKAEPGQKIAIVGPTGAGKTTMVNLLMRFYEIDSGEIRIDGVPIRELTRENVHELFCMVLQDTWLFEGTIKENIRYNKKDVSDEKIREACKVVGVDHFIRSLPKGYDSVIEDNDSMSAGQKQLITIARGMIEDSPFLILDEATSSVDTRTEELVQKAMDKLTEGRTSFIIAHRLSTIKNADLILAMKDGNIIEQGNHEELLAQNGFYADLYNSQFDEL